MATLMNAEQQTHLLTASDTTDSKCSTTEPSASTDVESAGVELKKEVSFISAMGMIVGCIIGAGIFISPAGVQADAGSPGASLIIWVAAGLLVLAGNFVYIELGLLINESGGDYVYIKNAFGDFIGFLRLWVEAIIIRPCTCTVVSITCAEYILKPIFEGDDLFFWYKMGFAFSMILFLTFMNVMFVKASLMLNNICTFIKGLALLVLVALGGYAALQGSAAAKESYSDMFANTATNPGKHATAFYSALFAYQGWNYLNFVMQEVKNPAKVFPPAVIVSTLFVTTVYVLCNMAFYAVLTPPELVSDEAAAMTFAVRSTGLQFAGVAMSILVAISCFGSGNGVVFNSSRLFMVGAQYSHMPRIFASVLPSTRTPAPAVLMMGFLSALYLLLSDNAVQLIGYMGISYWLAIALATASLFYYRLKYTKEQYQGVLKAPILVVIIFFLFCCGLVVFPLFSSTTDALIGLALVASGIPVYAIFVFWLPSWMSNISECAQNSMIRTLGLADNTCTAVKTSDDSNLIKLTPADLGVDQKSSEISP